MTGSTLISSSLVLKLDLKARGEACARQPALIDEADIGAAFGFIHVMGGDENGHAGVAQVVEQIPHLLAMDRIEAGGRLIEKKKRRLMDQGAGDGEELPHSAGETAGGGVAFSFQVGQDEQSLGCAFRFGPAGRGWRRRRSACFHRR